MVVRGEDLGPTTAARATCEFDNFPFTGPDTILISTRERFRGDLQFYRIEARHEMGHMIGLEHSGNQDANYSRSRDLSQYRTPTMATCLGSRDSANRLLMSQDDYQYISQVHSSLGRERFPGIAPITANVGFEQGLSFWGRTRQAIATLRNRGGATGPGHVRYRTNADSAYLYQTATFLTNGSDVNTAINTRAVGAGNTGQVRVSLYSRPVNYDKPDNNCPYPFVENMNSPTNTGQYRRATTQTITPTSSWELTIGNTYDLEVSQGYQMQIRVFNEVRTSTGGRASVDIDNLRIGCVQSNDYNECIDPDYPGGGGETG